MPAAISAGAKFKICDTCIYLKYHVIHLSCGGSPDINYITLYLAQTFRIAYGGPQ